MHGNPQVKQLQESFDLFPSTEKSVKQNADEQRNNRSGNGCNNDILPVPQGRIIIKSQVVIKQYRVESPF